MIYKNDIFISQSSIVNQQFSFPIFLFLLAEELHAARVLSISSFVERNDPTTKSFSRLSQERSILLLYKSIIHLFFKGGGIWISTRQGISNPPCTSGKTISVEYNLIKAVPPLSSRNFVALEIFIGKWPTVTPVCFIQIFIAKKSNCLVHVDNIIHDPVEVACTLNSNEHLYRRRKLKKFSAIS